MQDPLCPGGQRRVHDVDGPSVIDLPEVAAAAGPKLRIGGEMVNDLAAGDGSTNGRRLADVGGDEIDPVERQMAGRPVQDADPLAAVEQQPNQVQTDEAVTRTQLMRVVLTAVPWVRVATILRTGCLPVVPPESIGDQPASRPDR